MPRLPKGETPKRMQVQVPRNAYDAVEKLEATTGQDRKVVVGRVLSWLAEQDETVQKTIIYAMPESFRPEFAKKILELMANERDARETEDSERRRGESVVRSAQARQQDPPKKGRKHA